MEGVNNSVTELRLDMTLKQFSLLEIKNKFPNLSEIYIILREKVLYDIDIKMKKNSKNNIRLKYIDSLNIYFEPYEDLEKIFIHWEKQINWDNFPFFINNKGMFSSLLNFELI